MPDNSTSTDIRNRIWSRPNLVAASIALAVACVAGVFADRQNQVVHHQRERAEVSNQLGQVRARLEGNINSKIQLVQGLNAVITTEPDMNQSRFSEIAESLMRGQPLLNNIAGAPNLVVSLIHPVEGNRAALGLDYRANEAQREAAMRAARTGEVVIAGPVDLLQGGRGFIARFPVFADGIETPGNFWGIVSAVIDVDKLYSASGLTDADLPLEIAISGKDGTGKEGPVFFGDASLFNHDPVTVDVRLPSGSWHLAAIPRGGWTTNPPNAWQVRLFVLIGGLLIVIPILIAGHFYERHRTYIKELNRSERLLQQLSRRLTLALETSKIGVWEMDMDSGELTWDSRTRELYGIEDDAQKVCVEDWKATLHSDDRIRAEAEFEHALMSETPYNSEFRVRGRDGDVRWIRTIGATNRDADGRRNVIGVNWDVSQDIELKAHLMSAMQNAELRNLELEDARAQMEHNSLHDSLTGLPNRRYLDQRLAQTANDTPVTALLHIDLDRFKQINDTLGHAAGDAMLVHTASILKASSRSGDFIARIGGDEFVLAITGEAGESDLSRIASRIIDKLRQPVPYEKHECRFGVSIGIAFADPETPDFGKRLLIDADIALYRAKSNGRNRFEFFTNALKAEIIRNKNVADDILKALERGEFLPHFQPQFDARTLEVTGVEALARWSHPKEGLLTPDQFLHTADELNVVNLIDHTILKQVLWQSTRWKAAGIHIPKVGVNVSAGRFHEADLIESLEGLSFAPGTLSFELLESVFLDERDERVTRTIENLKRRGIEIEIDDFGSGYASIVSLVHIRPSRLKIDRQLILPIVGSESQQRLAASIIEIGRSLNIRVIAEGVETMEHAAILRDMGCDDLQGYALARPMPSEDLIEFMKDTQLRHIA
jgi:diguanylate cyclase (GGDEF)-like protein/PAS domain S-box-containing protein